MTTHGTALRVTPSIEREFHSAVIAQLPDLADEEMQRFNRNKGELGRLLREALAKNGKSAGNTYPLSVNYGMSIEDAVLLGRYDWTNEGITSKNFPTKREGTAEITLELVHFNRVISTDDALRELDRMGMRPAELHELLALGAKYPDVQREFPVVTFGSIWQNRYGYRHVPYLHRFGSKRHLSLHWLDLDWDEFFRFAAVSK